MSAALRKYVKVRIDRREDLCPALNQLGNAMSIIVRHVEARVLLVAAVAGLIWCAGLEKVHGQFGGPESPDIELVKEFDKDGNKRLDRSERDAARESLKSRGGGRRGPGGFFGGRGGRGRGNRPAGKPGPEVAVDDVKSFPSSNLYDPTVLRTIFLDFENDDWEQELAEFKPTDVEVPATMIADGKTYRDVGVSFRGASSFFMIPEGSKRSLNLSVDFVNDDQRLYGHKTLNLLNCNGDASMMSSYLYHYVSSHHMAAPKVNFVNVVINGRSWGVYANAQQFNKDFLKDNYDSKKGNRWKVKGSPRGDGGLRYMGDDIAKYKEKYQIKSKDKEEAWNDLVNLCRIIDQTPVDELESKLEPILDVDGVLWFLAVDVALVNSDGYWTRASDYSIYQNKDGVFHILPHDMNEAFRESRGGRGGPPGGRGRGDRGGGRGGPPERDRGGVDGQRPERPGRGGRIGGSGEQDQRRQRDGGRGGMFGGFFGGPPGGGGGGIELDPLVGWDNSRMPLRSKLLANENLKKKYLLYVKEIAEVHLNWKNIGQKVSDARELIAESVKADTRKLMTNKDFLAATDPKSGQLKEFCEKRAEYLLNHPAIMAASTEQVGR